jgi:hypothetical protein
MPDPERLVGEALTRWHEAGELPGLALEEAYDHLAQLVALARDEERAKRCPGCGAPKCLRVLGTNQSTNQQTNQPPESAPP